VSGARVYGGGRAGALALGLALVGAVALGGAGTARAADEPLPAAGAEHGAAAGAEHGAGHEGHKEGLFSWFTWNANAAEKDDPAHDYGPGFIFTLVNFGLLVLVLVRLLGKNIKDSVAERRRAVVRALEEAEAAKRAAEERHGELKRRLASLDADVQKLREEVLAEAHREAKLVLERAQARAERIAADAERAVASELLSARKALEHEVAAAAVAAASAILANKIEPDDKRRLEDEFLKQIA